MCLLFIYLMVTAATVFGGPGGGSGLFWAGAR
jgi:hypothetical protein